MRELGHAACFSVISGIQAQKLGVGDLLGVAKQLVAMQFGIFPRLVVFVTRRFAFYNQ